MNAITKSTSVAVLVTLGLALAVGAGPLWAEVKLPDRPEPCVEWAAQEVLAALQKAGVPPATADIPVAVDGKGMKAESFDLAVQDGRVTVMAQDAVGAMYGLLELAEQIGACGLAGEWAKVAAALKPHGSLAIFRNGSPRSTPNGPMPPDKIKRRRRSASVNSAFKATLSSVNTSNSV